MAEAETLVIAARIEANVIHVGDNVEVINEGVQGVRVTVMGTHTNVQGVQREVSLINTGDLFSSLAAKGVLSLTRLGVTEAREEIQVVLKHVSDLNRS